MMKKRLFFLGCLINILITALATTSCNMDVPESNSDYVTITYVTTTGKLGFKPTQTVKKGYKLTALDLPTSFENVPEGVEFGNWMYADGSIAKVDDVINENTTLIAKWNIDNTPPAKVTNLTAVSIGTGAILTWDDPEDADFFCVKISYKLNNTNKEVTIPKSLQTATIQDLEVGKEYVFEVKSLDFRGNISEAETVSLLMKDPDIPVITITPTVTQPTKSTYKVNVVVYSKYDVTKIKYAEHEASKNEFVIGGIDITNQSAFEVSQNGIYTVYAKNSDGKDDCKVINITNFDFVGPSEITDFNASYSHLDKTISLTWNEPKDLDYSKVIIEDGTNKYEIPKGTTKYVINNVEPDETTYTFTAITYDKLGNVSPTISRCFVQAIKKLSAKEELEAYKQSENEYIAKLNSLNKLTNVSEGGSANDPFKNKEYRLIYEEAIKFYKFSNDGHCAVLNDKKETERIYKYKFDDLKLYFQPIKVSNSNDLSNKPAEEKLVNYEEYINFLLSYDKYINPLKTQLINSGVSTEDFPYKLEYFARKDNWTVLATENTYITYSYTFDTSKRLKLDSECALINNIQDLIYSNCDYYYQNYNYDKQIKHLSPITLDYVSGKVLVADKSEIENATSDTLNMKVMTIKDNESLFDTGETKEIRYRILSSGIEFLINDSYCSYYYEPHYLQFSTVTENDLITEIGNQLNSALQLDSFGDLNQITITLPSTVSVYGEEARVSWESSENDLNVSVNNYNDTVTISRALVEYKPKLIASVYYDDLTTTVEILSSNTVPLLNTYAYNDDYTSLTLKVDYSNNKMESMRVNTDSNNSVLKRGAQYSFSVGPNNTLTLIPIAYYEKNSDGTYQWRTQDQAIQEMLAGVDKQFVLIENILANPCDETLNNYINSIHSPNPQERYIIIGVGAGIITEESNTPLTSDQLTQIDKLTNEETNKAIEKYFLDKIEETKVMLKLPSDATIEDVKIGIKKQLETMMTEETKKYYCQYYFSYNGFKIESLFDKKLPWYKQTGNYQADNSFTSIYLYSGNEGSLAYYDGTTTVRLEITYNDTKTEFIVSDQSSEAKPYYGKKGIITDDVDNKLIRINFNNEILDFKFHSQEIFGNYSYY